MKTSFWQLFKEFLKKEKKLVIVSLIAIFAVAWIVICEKVIAVQSGKISKLETENAIFARERDSLSAELKRLENAYTVIEQHNDSLKALLALYQKQLIEMEIKHKHQIDSLLNIPNDTVYVRLQPLFPNYDGSPLQYPFSGSQIRQIYSGALSFNMLSVEYGIQGKALNTCTDLNKGYEKGIMNLNSQINNLKDNINLADSQIHNYKIQVITLKKQVSRGKFWRVVFETTTAIATGIAIFK